MTYGDVNHLTAAHYLLTGRAVPRPDAPRSEDWPGYGAVLAKLGRGADALLPFVSMMPKVPDSAPRFVEQSHGQGAGWLGLPYEPLRIDADPSEPGYHVADFALHADGFRVFSLLWAPRMTRGPAAPCATSRLRPAVRALRRVR
jgi:hypothetical protein